MYTYKPLLAMVAEKKKKKKIKTKHELTFSYCGSKEIHHVGFIKGTYWLIKILDKIKQTLV